jgi:hypothetical protein
MKRDQIIGIENKFLIGQNNNGDEYDGVVVGRDRPFHEIGLTADLCTKCESHKAEFRSLYHI